ncbi:MAG TPA: hypothetical protein VMN81_13345 [Vicinamibacterales bacterium]|nr:hypothetical protein [Vicinamibacterales bacterium]
MKAHIINATIVVALAAGAAGAAACTSTVRQGTGNSYLIIDSLRGFSGATGADTGTRLNSDVITKDGVIADGGLVAFRVGLKDPLAPTSTNNSVTVNRYTVRYIRADGRNTPGVDVPFPFDGALTMTVAPDGTAEGTFLLVRLQAKLESPLFALRNQGGAKVISTIAEVTFFGQDQTGRAVSATGRISIEFADFPD